MRDVKDGLNRRLGGIASTRRLEADILNKTIYKETDDMKKSGKTSMALIAAILALALLAGVAFATGAAQSAFKQLSELFKGESGKYEAMDALSGADSIEIMINEASGTRFVIDQSYYDGEQLMLAYHIDNGVIDTDLSYAISGDEATSRGVFVNIKDKLSDADYAAFTERLAQSGAAGVSFTEYVLGDGVWLTGDALIQAAMSMDISNGVYIEYETPLPDTARGQDALALKFTLFENKCYYYAANAGPEVPNESTQSMRYYYKSERIGKTYIEATIPRDASGCVRVSGGMQTDIYAAQADAEISPVNVRATITLAIPGAWAVLWDSIDELIKADNDMIYTYALALGGETFYGMTQNNVDGLTCAMQFDFPVALTGQTELRLRPVYAISGAREAEDIVIPYAAR